MSIDTEGARALDALTARAYAAEEQQAAPDDGFGGTGLQLADLEAMQPQARYRVMVSTLALLRQRAAEIAAEVRELETYLRADMLNQGASLLVTPEFEVKLKEKVRYEYDVEGLSQLQMYVEPADYERAIKEVVEVKVNKTELNKLARRGGPVAQIIDQSVWKKVIASDLEISKRKQVVTPA